MHAPDRSKLLRLLTETRTLPELKSLYASVLVLVTLSKSGSFGGFRWLAEVSCVVFFPRCEHQKAFFGINAVKCREIELSTAVINKQRLEGSWGEQRETSVREMKSRCPLLRADRYNNSSNYQKNRAQWSEAGRIKERQRELNQDSATQHKLFSELCCCVFVSVFMLVWG